MESQVEILEPSDSATALMPDMSSSRLDPFSRRLSRLEVYVVRELTPDDLLIALDSTIDLAPTSLTTIRSAHHRLAQLLCSGKSRPTVALLTGYSSTYIARLEHDPAFCELLEYYRAQQADIFIDSAKLMQNLGAAAMEELQSRLEENPEGWSRRELMELAKLATPVPGAGGNGQVPSVAVNVQFVTGHNPEAGPGPVIEGKVAALPPEQEI